MPLLTPAPALSTLSVPRIVKDLSQYKVQGKIWFLRTRRSTTYKQPLQTEELVTDGLRLRLKSVQVVERKTTGALKDVVAKARQSKVAPKDQRPGRRRRKQ